MFVFVLPCGSRMPVEPWVHREWVHNRAAFFDPELGAQMDSAVRVYRRHATC